MYQVEFYEDGSGKSPVREWLISLNSKNGKRTELTQFESKINIIKELGTRASSDTVVKLSGDIWEIRPGKNRILFAFWYENKILLLHQYLKKTNKCPPSEIEKAKRELKDWLERKGK